VQSLEFSQNSAVQQVVAAEHLARSPVVGKHC